MSRNQNNKVAHFQTIQNVILDADWSNLCHVMTTTKMLESLDKDSISNKTKYFASISDYEGILLVKLLWQNQNYQLVLDGGQD